MNAVKSFLSRVSYRGPIGLIIILAGFAFLFLLTYKSIPAANEQLILVAMGFVLGMLKDVSGYFFGASKDKTDADHATNITQLATVDKQTNTAQAVSADQRKALLLLNYTDADITAMTFDAADAIIMAGTKKV